MIMTPETIMHELEALGSEQTKKTYIAHGAHEPLFGVLTGAMKPLAKKIKRNQPLADALYATGNYDAMYFAGLIADPNRMTEADFERWIEAAYCYALSDFTVANVLVETGFAQTVADRWIDSGKEFYMSSGWSCYCRLLGMLPDGEFHSDKIRVMLDQVRNTIHNQPNRTRYAMNNFVIAAGISYLPLHAEAAAAAQAVGKVHVDMGKTACRVPLAAQYIQKAVDAGRLGSKRKP